MHTRHWQAAHSSSSRMLLAHPPGCPAPYGPLPSLRMCAESESDRQRRAEWRPGMYVRVHGHISSFGKAQEVIAFNIRPVVDHNEVRGCGGVGRGPGSQVVRCRQGATWGWRQCDCWPAAHASHASALCGNERSAMPDLLAPASPLSLGARSAAWPAALACPSRALPPAAALPPPQITYHFLQCIFQHVHLTKGGGAALGGAGAAALGGVKQEQAGGFGGAPAGGFGGAPAAGVLQQRWLAGMGLTTLAVGMPHATCRRSPLLSTARSDASAAASPPCATWVDRIAAWLPLSCSCATHHPALAPPAAETSRGSHAFMQLAPVPPSSMC